MSQPPHPQPPGPGARDTSNSGATGSGAATPAGHGSAVPQGPGPAVRGPGPLPAVPPGSATDGRDHGPADGRPRLGPRPVDRPPVDPAQSATFGRPPGLDGAFAPRGPHGAHANGMPLAPPAPESFARAFGRPIGADGADTPLQRPPVRRDDTADDGPAFWSDDAERDPWRDPGAHALLGAPAVVDEPAKRSAPRDDGARLSMREVLFGRRVAPRALVGLVLVALLVGAAGGLVGRLTAEGADPLTDPDATIAQAQPARERPPGSVPEVSARVVPAVVSIEIRVGQNGGTGSGVMIDPQGYVVTNNHVVSLAATNPDATLEAVFADQSRVAARIVGRDPKTDLAVLKVDVANPVVATLGRSAELQVGDAVIAIGSPLGLAGTVTTGIVSAVDRPVRLDGEGTDTNAVIDAIQTDAAINPGNSGGALVDAGGAVVGINTAIRTLSETGGGSIGLGFAIPIDDVTEIAQELIRTGSVKHAELGVNAKSVTDGTADGAQVQNVQQGSAAAEAGIVDGDVITRIGDRPIASADELVVAVREWNIGDRVPVGIVRQGRPLTVQVVLKSD